MKLREDLSYFQMKLLDVRMDAFSELEPRIMPLEKRCNDVVKQCEVQLLHSDQKAETTCTFSSTEEVNTKPKKVQKTKVERRSQLNPFAAPYDRDCDNFWQMGSIQPEMQQTSQDTQSLSMHQIPIVPYNYPTPRINDFGKV